MRYCAHSLRGQPESLWHPLSDHLLAVACLAEKRLKHLGLGDLGRIAGLLHDLGKYSPEFQRRIRGAPEAVDHSTFGAKLAVDRYRSTPAERLAARMLAQCILGHHGGLPDGTDIDERLRAAHPAADWQGEIELPANLAAYGMTRRKVLTPFQAHVICRMLFSALVDADHTDTGAFYHPRIESAAPSLQELRRRLRAHMDRFPKGGAGSVNAIRGEVLAHARRRIACQRGSFTLTVPTGGGKTLAALSCALEHAIEIDARRIIYVAPYISIIEQTAEVYREALGDDPARPIVVEHHSSYETDPKKVSPAGEWRLRQAAENWDAPIIVTTAVQFYESLWGNKPSRSRKVHNIANSVVILDEAQMTPLPFLRPCVAMLNDLAENWGCGIIYCTATQPAITKKEGFRGGPDAIELAPGPRALAGKLKRVKFARAGRLDLPALAGRLSQIDNILCVVNTKRRARDLHSSLRGPGTYHLSTWMCAAHRKEVLADIKQRLAQGQETRIISTSLIECGVDIDLPVVYREAAGLESIIQSAGRCNREGKRSRGEAYVYEPGKDEPVPREIKRRWRDADEAWRWAERRNLDLLDPLVYRQYCSLLYWARGPQALDEHGILDAIRAGGGSAPFAWIAAKVKFIDDESEPVVVAYGGSSALLQELRQGPLGSDLAALARKLQRYTVSIAPSAKEKLLAAGAVERIRPDVYGDRFYAAKQAAYSSETGLLCP